MAGERMRSGEEQIKTSRIPKELKDYVADKLNATVIEMYGIENFTDMICDETIASDSEGVLAFLEEIGI